MIFLLLLALTSGVSAQESTLRPFRFAEVKKIAEKEGLPPKLEVTFEKMCNEELVQIVRHEWIDERSKKVSIAVGALVRENSLSSCAGVRNEMTSAAGNTFSGREYEVVRIRANALPPNVAPAPTKK